MKKTKLYKLTMLLIAMAMSTNLLADGTQPTGSGTQADPYMVAILDNLLWISTTSSSWASYYEQSANIDASGTSTWNGGDGFIPIGNSTTQFTGTYDGQGNTISGLTIDRGSTDFIGLFGYTDGATIFDLGLLNVDITGNDYIAGLIGYCKTSTVTNCYSTGTVTGNNYTGGLLGIASGTSTSDKNITSDCYSSCSVTGGSYTGGFAGCSSANSETSFCHSTGSVTGNDRVGGFNGAVGGSTAQPGRVDYCYSTGNVTGNGYYTGGFVGFAWRWGYITNCCSRGNVIRSSGSTSTLIGAFGGDNFQNYPSNCYCTGDVTYNGDPDPTDKGFFGDNDYSGNNFWDSEASNQTTAYSATAKTTAEMKRVTTFTNTATTGLTTAWDFIADPFDDAATNDYWDIDVSINDGYPRIIKKADEPTATAPGGSGTSGAPYQIASLENLFWLTKRPDKWSSSVYYKQTADINASATSGWAEDYGWSPIGGNYTIFEANYDGDTNTISGLTMDRGATDYIGLFGYVEGVTIENLGLTSVNIVGKDNTGALVGNNYNSSTVTYCYSTGSVTGATQTGGLAGYNNSSTISNCYSTCNVNGTNQAGALVGYNRTSSTVSNCYSRGNVTRSSGTNTYLAAFCGSNNGSTIEYCYSTGDVTCGSETSKGFVGYSTGTPTYTNNFWDSDASNQTTATGATGKTTNQMTTESTFTDAGWDFIVETTNGTNDYWSIDGFNNDQYPWLTWEDYAPVTITWDGSVSVDWFNRENWHHTNPSLNSVPTFRNIVVVIGTSNDPEIDTGNEGHSYEVDCNGGILTVKTGGTLTVTKN